MVVRFPAGPRVRLKTVDPPKGNGLGQKKAHGSYFSPLENSTQQGVSLVLLGCCRCWKGCFLIPVERFGCQWLLLSESPTAGVWIFHFPTSSLGAPSEHSTMSSWAFPLNAKGYVQWRWRAGLLALAHAHSHYPQADPLLLLLQQLITYEVFPCNGCDCVLFVCFGFLFVFCFSFGIVMTP